MATTTVGPGKTYTYLQDWEDWAAGTGVNQAAECYSGSLGPLIIGGWTGGAATIRPATGQGHDGIKGSGAGAYIDKTDGNAIDIQLANTQVWGLRLRITATSASCSLRKPLGTRSRAVRGLMAALTASLLQTSPSVSATRWASKPALLKSSTRRGNRSCWAEPSARSSPK